MSADQLLKAAEVAAMTGIPRTSVYRLMATGAVGP